MQHFLVVDDSSFARMMVRRCLETAGVPADTIQEAEDGQQALNALRGTHTIDVIISDLNMPVLDGRSMLRRIRASPRLCHIPVIIVSSLVNDERRADLMQLGAHAVVSKPLTPQMMLSLCATLEPRP